MPNLNTGALASAISGLVSSVIAILAIFHVIAWTQPQNTAVVVAAVTLAGLLFYVAGLLHWYGTASFDVAQLTTLLTAAVSAVFALLTAFNLPDFSPQEQASLLSSLGTLVAMGVAFWSYLKTHQAKAIRAAAAKQARPR